MSAHKIIEGIKQAIAGNIAAVTIDGQRWVRAPSSAQVQVLQAQAFDLTCDQQYDLAQRIAANVGYVLAPEPEHPDSPRISLNRLKK